MWFGLGNARVRSQLWNADRQPHQIEVDKSRGMTRGQKNKFTAGSTKTENFQKITFCSIRKMWDENNVIFALCFLNRLAWTGAFCNILARSKCSAWNKGRIKNCTWFPNNRKSLKYIFIRHQDFASLTKIRIQTHRVSEACNLGRRNVIQCNTRAHHIGTAKDHEIAFVREACI